MRLVTYLPRAPEQPKMVATRPEKDDLNPWPLFIAVNSGTVDPSDLLMFDILDFLPVSDRGRTSFDISAMENPKTPLLAVSNAEGEHLAATVASDDILVLPSPDQTL